MHTVVPEEIHNRETSAFLTRIGKAVVSLGFIPFAEPFGAPFLKSAKLPSPCASMQPTGSSSAAGGRRVSSDANTVRVADFSGDGDYCEHEPGIAVDWSTGVPPRSGITVDAASMQPTWSSSAADWVLYNRTSRSTIAADQVAAARAAHVAKFASERAAGLLVGAIVHALQAPKGVLKGARHVIKAIDDCITVSRSSTDGELTFDECIKAVDELTDASSLARDEQPGSSTDGSDKDIQEPSEGLRHGCLALEKRDPKVRKEKGPQSVRHHGCLALVKPDPKVSKEKAIKVGRRRC